MNAIAHDRDAPGSKDSIPVLGFAPMDDVHADFDALLQQGLHSDGGNWLTLLTSIDEHLRLHFSLEDRWMTETDFPPKDCHMQEHAAVLKSSSEVLELARRGDFHHAQSFISHLADWFPGHANYLDSALATWMCKRQYGGKPVVFHRARTNAK